MKRKIFGIFAVLAMLTAMTGCGSEESADGGKESSAAETKIKQLTGAPVKKITELPTETSAITEADDEAAEEEMNDEVSDVLARFEEEKKKIDDGDLYNINNERVDLP